MRRIIIVALSICLLFGLAGCTNNNSKEPTIISDIAYDNNSDWGYRVYIQENGEYKPFLVLTNRDDGSTLLLREFLLDEAVAYNEPKKYSSYYENSNVDNYLNNKYSLAFSEKMKSLILNTDIEITSKNALDTHKNELTVINRKFFLLSATETNHPILKSALKENKTISYFKNVNNHIATYESGKSDFWILRTAELNNAGIESVVAYSADGVGGTAPVNSYGEPNKCPVRPAFCVPSSTAIVERNDIIDGNTVYGIK